MDERIPLSKTQTEVMDFIYKFQKEKGYAPTIQEIAEERGTTRTTNYDLIIRLADKGYLKKYISYPRGIRLINYGD